MGSESGDVMSFWDSIFGSGVEAAGNGVNAALSGVGTLAKDIRTAVTGEIDPAKRAELQAKAMELETALAIAQANINIEEAKSQSLFVSGWRPFIGWVCGTGLAYHFIGFSLLEWLVKLMAWQVNELPKISSDGLLELTVALLGLAGLRTIERARGVQNQ